MLQVNTDSSHDGPGSVSVCCLGPDVLALLATDAQQDDLLRSVFRVSVAPARSLERDRLPNVSGRYLLFEDEVHFIPHFPFERDVKYRASFDLRPLAPFPTEEPLMLEFVIPSEHRQAAPTIVTQVFPSSDLLPENLLRFYVCFSNSMQRGRALEQISLLDSDGQPVADALYRAPIELWDRTMRRLTVLLDPGRLKRWVGPNVQLGPPLKAGQAYTLEIGSGMSDQYGRSLQGPFRKHFVVSEPVRDPIFIESWKTLPPATGSRQHLALRFTYPLDWALLFHAITVESPDGSVIEGRVMIDQCEKQWTFTPNEPWVAGTYQVRVASYLEDACGNSMTGAFDRPLQRVPGSLTERNSPSLAFHLT